MKRKYLRALSVTVLKAVMSFVVCMTTLTVSAQQGQMSQQIKIQPAILTRHAVVDELEGQTNYNVIFNTQTFNANETVRFDTAALTIADVLDRLVEGTGHVYKTEGNYIVIYENEVVRSEAEPVFTPMHVTSRPIGPEVFVDEEREVVAVHTKHENTEKILLHYRLNSSVLEPKLYSNEHSLERLGEILSNRLIMTNVDSIVITSGASPEGPMYNNERLAYNRGNAVKNYIEQNYPHVDHSKVINRPMTTDWSELYNLVDNDDNCIYKNGILNILDSKLPDMETIAKLKAMDNGMAFNFIIREYGPRLRYAASEVYYITALKDTLQIPPPILALPPLPPLGPLTIDMSFEPVPLQPEPECRFFAVKTNALFLAALTANVGFEIELWRKWSIDIPIWYSPYDISSSRKLRLLAVQPELRRWTKKAGEGHFFGLHTHVAGFNVAINDHGRYQDPNHALWGMGLGYGYVTHLDKQKRWAMEFNIGAGFADYKYDAYQNTSNGEKYRSGSDCYWGVTRAGVSVQYKWYKQRNK